MMLNYLVLVAVVSTIGVSDCVKFRKKWLLK